MIIDDMTVEGMPEVHNRDDVPLRHVGIVDTDKPDTSTAGTYLASVMHMAPALGFVPVAIHFRLFEILVKLETEVSATTVTQTYYEWIFGRSSQHSPLSTRLTEDTLYVMSSLGFVDYIDNDIGDTFSANAVTKHIVMTPSALHGMDHFTRDQMWGGVFLFPKLCATNFRYPFAENETPTQFGYQATGQTQHALEHFYTILAKQDRMKSFDLFMEGKFGRFGTNMPQRLVSHGYDLEKVLQGVQGDDVAWVDIGGGLGEQLCELHDCFPWLKSHQMVLQEYQPMLPPTPAHFMTQKWDYKSSIPQPIEGSRVYSLTHIFHNLSDPLAYSLLKKIAHVMKPGYSKLLIQEFSRNKYYGKMHAGMIVLFGGRERSRAQWAKLASDCGLCITFAVYPALGEGLIEMMKMQ